MLEEYYASICPPYVTHEIRADQKPWERIHVKGRDLDSDYDINMQAPFNMLSRLPVLSVSAGIARNGLPGGVQVVARSYDDARVFYVGRAIERALPWLDCAARRPMAG